MDLTTVDNEWWGLTGGSTVSVTFVYLSKSTGFNNRLPDEVKELVQTDTDDPNDLPTSGEFKGFPHYSTDAASIDSKQANLLANLAGFVVQENEELFRAALEQGG